MHDIEDVLVPVDFSTFSQSALAFARQLGDLPTSGARLHLGHAVESMPPYVRSVLYPYAPLGEDDREFEAELAESVRAEMRRFFDIDGDLQGRLGGTLNVSFGSSSDCIADWSATLNVDLVAVGAFGRHGGYPGGPGSTARRVAAMSTQPVALIRDYEPQPRIERIGVAVDLGEETSHIVEVAARLAIDQGAELELIHVIPSPYAHDTNWRVERHIDVDAKALDDSVRPVVRRAMIDVVDAIDAEYGSGDAFGQRLREPSIAVGDPATEIGEYAAARDVDLLVFGSGRASTGQPSGLGRVASAIMAGVARHQVVVPSGPNVAPLDRI